MKRRAPKTIRKVARAALAEHRRQGGGGRKAPAFAKKLAAGRALSDNDMRKMAFLGKHRAGRTGTKTLGRMYGGKEGSRWASAALKRAK